MTPTEYLDACKEKLEIRSDYELAHRLEWNKQGISNVKKGQRSMPSDIAYKVADILGLDHGVVWADIEAHQEKNPEKRAYWRSYLDSRAASLAAVLCSIVLAGVTSIVTSSPAEAATTEGQGEVNLYYVNK